jgi:hypothetical protein|eukprot:COSAG01_NODE_51678_length_352_cov_108.739130_1_plen_86_part_10
MHGERPKADGGIGGPSGTADATLVRGGCAGHMASLHRVYVSIEGHIGAECTRLRLPILLDSCCVQFCFSLSNRLQGSYLICLLYL